MRQFIYQTIYNSQINKVLRNLNKALEPILPKKIKIPPSGMVTLRNEDGKTVKVKTNQTCFVTYLTFWFGYENFEYTTIFSKLIRKVDVFYDIGANIGYYSLLATMENPGIKTIAFEPAEGPLFFLEENVKINQYKNIKVESLALSEKNGEIEFREVKNHKYTYLEHNLAGAGNAGGKEANRNFVSTIVKTKKLDEYVKNEKEEKLDLIKIDTEGTEHLILGNAPYVLGELKPIIICETLFNLIESELDDLMSSYGYEFYNHIEGEKLIKVDSIKREKDDLARNCFFVHPSKAHLVQEFL